MSQCHTGIGRVLGISRDRVRNLERDGLRV